MKLLALLLLIFVPSVLCSGIYFIGVDVPTSSVSGVKFTLNLKFSHSGSFLDATSCADRNATVVFAKKSTSTHTFRLCDDDYQFIDTIEISNVKTDFSFTNDVDVTVTGLGSRSTTIWNLPGFLTIIPPILLIIFAIITKQTFPSIFFTLIIAETFIYKFNPIKGFLNTIGSLFPSILGDPENAAILIFTMLLASIIGMLSRTAANSALLGFVSKFAKDSKRTILAVLLLGLLLFFDDYCNILITGSVMSLVTKKKRVSPAKLAYVIDIVSASCCSLFIATSWIGFQANLIDVEMTTLSIDSDAIVFIVKTIPYSFYSILSLYLCFLTVVTGRDVGVMYTAEENCRVHGVVETKQKAPDHVVDKVKKRIGTIQTSLIPKEQLQDDISDLSENENEASGVHLQDLRELAQIINQEIGCENPHAAEPILDPDNENDRAMLNRVSITNSLVPVVTLFLVLVIAILYLGVTEISETRHGLEQDFTYYTDMNATAKAAEIRDELDGSKHTYGILDILANTDPFVAILWASATGLLLSTGIALRRSLVDFHSAFQIIYAGFKTVIEPLCALVGAFSLGYIIKKLGTTQYLAQNLDVPLMWLPFAVGILAACIGCFSGSVFSTLALLYPFCFALAKTTNPNDEVLLASVAATMGLSILGNQLTLLSDTSIFSALVAGTTAFEHVRTQIPYTVSAGIVSFILYIFAGLRVNPVLLLIIGAAVLTAYVFVFGKKVTVYKGEVLLREDDISDSVSDLELEGIDVELVPVDE
ncbi:hypothetical protein PCE1_002693 [Barthelona sp. PCE]